MELSPQEIDAIFLSIKVSIWSVVFSLLPAVYIAYVLSRKNFWGRQALNVLVHIPLILPPVVTGYFLLIFQIEYVSRSIIMNVIPIPFQMK